MLSPRTAAGLFEVLLEELEIDPACRDAFVTALIQGAERIRFHGFSELPKRSRPRLLLVQGELEHIRCPRADQEKLDLERRRRVVSASRRIACLLAVPEAAPLGARSRVSALAS